jgi:hypothetical protein
MCARAFTSETNRQGGAGHRVAITKMGFSNKYVVRPVQINTAQPRQAYSPAANQDTRREDEGSAEGDLKRR